MNRAIADSYPDAELTAEGNFSQLHLSIGGSSRTKP